MKALKTCPTPPYIIKKIFKTASARAWDRMETTVYPEELTQGYTDFQWTLSIHIMLLRF